jgi:hypothetical protein
MEVEGTFKIRKREEGPFDVSFEPKEQAGAPRRSRSFSGYDGMRRYLQGVGVKQGQDSGGARVAAWPDGQHQRRQGGIEPDCCLKGLFRKLMKGLSELFSPFTRPHDQ